MDSMRHLLLIAAISMSLPYALGADDGPLMSGDRGHTHSVTAGLDVDLYYKFLWNVVVDDNPYTVDERMRTYIISDNALNCFDSEGDMLWSFEAAGLNDQTPLVDGEGRSYVTARAAKVGYLYAVSDDGSKAWSVKFDLQFSVISNPALLSDGSLAVFLDNGTAAHVSGSGSVLGYTGPLGRIYAGGDVLVDPEDNLIKDCGGKVISLSMDEGKNWEFETDVGALSVGGDGKVFIASNDPYGNTTCLYKNGTVAFWNDLGAAQISVADDGSFVEFSGARLHAYDGSGNFRWNALCGTEDAYPVIMGDGRVLIGGSSIRVYLPNGSLNWSFRPPEIDFNLNRPLPMGVDAILFYSDGKLWCYRGIMAFPPRGFDGTDHGSFIRLVWTRPEGEVIGYKVYRTTMSGDTRHLQYLATVDDTTYDDRDPIVGTSFYYLRTVTSEGDSELSDVLTVYHVRPVPCNEIYNINVYAKGSDERVEVQLYSSVPPGSFDVIDGIVVARSEGEGPYRTIGNMSANSTTFIDRDIDYGRRYKYRVTITYYDGSTDSDTDTVEIRSLWTKYTTGWYMVIIAATNLLVAAGAVLLVVRWGHRRAMDEKASELMERDGRK